jgi:integrase
MDENQTTAIISLEKAEKRNKNVSLSTIQRSEAGAGDYVSHLSAGDVKLLATVASKNKLHGESDSLLIKTIFDTALRVSEASGHRPCDIHQTPDGRLVHILGKGAGGKPGTAAITAATAAELQAFCYRHKIGETSSIFNVCRSQAFRVVQAAYDAAGIRQPCQARDHVVAVHVLRHSGAIARLAISGNPRAVQGQLRHKSAQITLRYLKTIGHDEAMRIQQNIDIWQ